MSKLGDQSKLKVQEISADNPIFHALAPESVAKLLITSVSNGLSEQEAADRLKIHGADKIERRSSGRLFQYLIGQASSVVVWLLALAAFVAWITGNELESYAIVVVLVMNALIGFIIEWQAGRALEALRRTTRATARVRRNGRERIVDASELVPGDIVALTAGDRVPADARLFEAVNLKADESTLTGESVPVDKHSDAIEDSTPLAERSPMLYLGSTIVAGRAIAIVTALGSKTEIGRIGHLVSQAASSRTPLEKRLAKLGKRLVYAVLGIAVIVFLAGVLRGDEFWLMIEVAISLAVAAVPEGLPAVTTLILALGVLRMARRNAIVRRLSAVETLGSSTVICTDKTGTLTKNRMTVREFQLSNGQRVEIEKGNAPAVDLNDNLGRSILVGVLCNEAAGASDTTEEHVIGDPTETAILNAAQQFSLSPQDIRAKYSIVFEQPFDASTKRMTVVLEDVDKKRFAAMKGAPAVVMEACDSYIDNRGNISSLDEELKTRFSEINGEMASRALRVLGLAEKPIETGPDTKDQIRDGFVFLGYVGINDPIRAGAVKAVEQAQRAGIRVVMLTGDQLNTARAIARDLGLSKDPNVQAVHSSDLLGSDDEKIVKLARNAEVFARVTPEDKLRIVRALQDAGEIVAVTGDGVNDAPALKQADIGVAMGLRGTEVAKEASDIVLTDDNFSTIVAAIEGGRTIYANILKFVHLMFSQNLSEVLVIFAAILVGLPLPLLPLQILWINLVTDVFPALALAVEPPSPSAMERKPIPPDKSMLSRSFMFLILWQGIVLSAIALSAYIWALNSYGAGAHSQTIALLAVVGVQLGHLFNCRSRSRSAFSNFFSNPYLFAAAAIVILLQLLAVFLTPLAAILNTVPPNGADLIVIATTIVVPVIIVEFTKYVSRNSTRSGL